MTRREARRHGFSLVFQLPFHPQENESVAQLIQHYYDGLEAEGVPKSRHVAYINRIMWGVFDRQEQIDQVISKFLRGWSLQRISKMDLAFLRVAIYEMLCEKDVPIATAITEAIEMAKEYGTDDSPSFVNGVLANVNRSFKKEWEEKAES